MVLELLLLDSPPFNYPWYILILYLKHRNQRFNGHCGRKYTRQKIKQYRVLCAIDPADREEDWMKQYRGQVLTPRQQREDITKIRYEDPIARIPSLSGALG